MIRPSGGKLIVTVRKKPSRFGSVLDRAHGTWRWTVPAPKGHPRTPSWTTLTGRAHTMEAAVAAGLNRMQEVYS